MNSSHEITPELSIVVTTRNDNHGGNLQKRMRLCFNGILALAERNQLVCELIVVEWNPPADKTLVAKDLPWPKSNKYCSVRFIEVSNELHNKFKHAANLPLYQMIGKNVGIRRARGRFVLSTNIDILFSEELFVFFASGKMVRGTMYRVDRYDTDGDIVEADDISDQLVTALQSTFRICTRGGSWNCRTGDYDLVIGTLADSGKNTGRRFPLHTNACGDFTLMSREDWFDIYGHWETDAFSFHLDSILCFTAHYAGIKEEFLASPMWIHHIEHDSGWTPEIEKAGTLEKQLQSGGITKISNNQLERYCADMAKTSRPLKSPNDINWGMAAEKLPEQFVVVADWDLKSSEIGHLITSLPIPPRPLFPAKTGLSDTPDSTGAPYISFIVSVHHDQIEKSLELTQHLVNALADQCERFNLVAELILVDWNYGSNEVKMANKLKMPRPLDKLTIRLFNVSPEEHAKLQNANHISHFDLVGCNAGVRRAEGKFVLITDIDVTLSNSLVQFLSLKRLDAECFYCADLIDLSNMANDFDITTSTPDSLLHKYLDSTFSDTLQAEGNRKFTLMHRGKFEDLYGYPEMPIESSDISSLLLSMAHTTGLTQITLRAPLAMSLEQIRKRNFEEQQHGIPILNANLGVAQWVETMMFEKQIISPNQSNWGLAEIELPHWKITEFGWQIVEPVEIDKRQIGGISNRPEDRHLKVADQIKRGTNHLFLAGQSSRTLLELERLVEQYEPVKIIEFGSGFGLTLRSWLAADANLKVVSVGENLANLRASFGFASIDESRVELMDLPLSDVDLPALYPDNERCIIFVNVAEMLDANSIERIQTSLPENSLMIIDGLWRSPVPLIDSTAYRFFTNNMFSRFDPMQCFSGFYSPYWRGGSLIGCDQLLKFAKLINQQGLELEFPTSTSIAILNTSRTVGQMDRMPERITGMNGTFYYNPTENWEKTGDFEDPTMRSIQMLCAQGSSFFGKEDISTASIYFAEALTIHQRIIEPQDRMLLKAALDYENGNLEDAMEGHNNWKAGTEKFGYFSGLENILVCCLIRLGNFNAALDIGSTALKLNRFNLSLLNNIRRHYIETNSDYSIWQ